MTDRIKGFTVALSQDLRDDDCQPIVDAINMIRGVESVTPLVTSSDDWLARQNVKAQIREHIIKLVDKLN